jgi:hypothetical protein
MSDRNLLHVVLDIGLTPRDLRLIVETSSVVCLVVIVLLEIFLKQDQRLAENDVVTRVVVTVIHAVVTQTHVEVTRRVTNPHVKITAVQNEIDLVQADQAVKHLVNVSRVTADQAGNMVRRVVVILRKDCHCCYNVLV